MNQQRKRRRGDRADATRLTNLDSMHTVMAAMLPNRTDNEAFINDAVDIAPLEAYVKRRNAENPEHRYTMFQMVLAALGRTIAMRPRMNHFIMGTNFYERHDITFSLIAKQAFADDGKESVAILTYDPKSEEPAADMMHKRLTDFVYAVRHDEVKDDTTDIMDVIVKTGLTKFIMETLRKLDTIGRMPRAVAEADPYNSTVFVSNLGSIKLNAGYHHLTNWGTNSIFLVIGEKKMQPVYHEDGTVTVKPVLPIGFTLDERIADGYYYARTIQLFKHILTHPELLDIPAKEELEFDAISR